MDPMGEEQIDYEDDDYGGGGGGAQKHHQHYPSGGAISALADEDDDYDDLYNDVNVGEGFMHHHHPQQQQQQQQQHQQQHQNPNPNPQTHADPSANLRQSYVTPIATGGYPGYQDRPPAPAGGAYSAAPPSQAPGARTQENPPDLQSGNLGFQASTGPVRGSGITDQSLNPAGGVLPLPVPTGVNRAPPAMNRPMQPQQQLPVQPLQASVPAQMEGGGNCMLFVGELHWWTTDSDIENELSRYGRVKEIKFFDERASGKSKGYCQVEFENASSAAACKEGMNGHLFNGRPCAVAFATQQTMRQMGATYSNRANSSQNQPQRRGNEGRPANFQTGGNNMGNRNWGRGQQGMQNRGQGMNGMQNRMKANPGIGSGPMGKGMVPGNAFVAPPFGGPPAAMMQPMGPAFDPTYGAMGRGVYGGFSAAPFPGMMPSFQPVNPAMGLPGVAPHVNPAFFGRGNAMGMMGGAGMDGSGMWNDPSMQGWTGEEQVRTREMSYGDDGASDYGYGESHERGGRSGNASREKDRGGDPERERDWGGNSERRHREERDSDWEHDRYKDDRNGGYSDQKHKDRDYRNDDEWDRERSSSSRSRPKPRIAYEEEQQRSRSKDVDYGKRRRSD